MLLLILPAATGFAATIDENEISCLSAMVIDQDTGEVLYEKNAQEQIYPASTTKIMTTILAIEQCGLDDEVTVGAEVNITGSKLGIIEGETLTVEQLIHGMILVSGNDAASALAVHISGSVDEFANLMNEKAKEIGMTHTHFVNACGLQDEEHYTTCEDMAKLALYSKKYPEIQEIASKKSYTIPKTNKSEEREIFNTNKLIYNKTPEDQAEYAYQYATGIKTGSTPAAGGCLVSSATKDGRNLIALVFGDMTEEGVNRWKISKTLFEYGFNGFQNIPLSEIAENIPVEVTIENAAEQDEGGGVLVCDPVFEEDRMITVPVSESGETEQPEVTAETVVNSGLTAPIEKGQVVGSVRYMMDGDVIYTADLTASRAVLTQAEYDLKEMGTEEPGQTAENPAEKEPVPVNGYVWLWLLIPAGLIIFIIVRAVVVKRRRARRFARRGRRQVYRYPARRRRRRF